MASIPGISVSALTAKNENQLALANLNFDFSLVKLAAPDEFRPLGQALSSWRRATAESGSAHRTARKLGALFDQVVQPGDELVKAYGQRASDISSSPKAKPKPTYKLGLFEKHAGADGTAIWAAATSGKPAIAVVFLAFMLARLWDAPKAISIWSELIEKRKSQITETCDGTEPSHIAPLAAAQQELTRRDLAEWDSNARSWLAIADQVKATEHKRLDVIRAWSTAMNTMEKLIKGMPQRIHNGAALIAISAWHIYPDVDLFGSHTLAIHQQDTLVQPGGRLTVGLEDAEPVSGQGVYWSLSLANLHYYGDPVYTTNHVKDETRVSFSEITLVALGSLFAGWESPGFDAHFDRLDAARFLIALWNTLKKVWIGSASSMTHGAKGLLRDIISQKSWLNLLTMAAETMLDKDPAQSQRAQKLVSLGVRDGKEFLQPKEQRAEPFFGLSEPRVVLVMLRDAEARIGALRAIARKMSLKNACQKAIIRYISDETGSIEYATVLPRQHEQRRDRSGNLKVAKRHRRWIDSTSVSFSRRQVEIETIGEEWEEFNPYDVSSELVDQCIYWYGKPKIYAASERLIAHQEALLNDTVESDLSWMEQVVDFDRLNRTRYDKYEYLLGHIETAALFVQYKSEGDPSAEVQKPVLTSLPELEMTRILLKSRFSETKLVYHIGKIDASDGMMPEDTGTQTASINSTFRRPGSNRTTRPPTLYRSLQTLSTAARVYALLPDATIALRVLEHRLWKVAWMPPASPTRGSAFQPQRLSLSQTFSCVAMFDTGTLNINHSELDKVFAISLGSSIFAATRLLIDPYKECEESELRQIVGNVGRAGASMLIPPGNPVLRKPGIDSWQAINHEPFALETECEDYFDKTSLHLSFTGYEQPVASAVHHGAQDTEACYLETLVSIFDGSRKIGDVDILKALKSPILHRGGQAYDDECQHGRRGDRRNKRRRTQTPRWICVDSWDELLELPEGKIGIVRAHQNPFARLAAAAACVQKGFERKLSSSGSETIRGFSSVCEPVVIHFLLDDKESPLEILNSALIMSLDNEQLEMIAREDIMSKNQWQKMERETEVLDATPKMLRGN
ncbi:hypothetical protein F5Y08DRAFT_336708 [Xylaria arbuscula]|nr:hypothetical protein F5Y08DRAFT_336708 [Xylaria arbuscula]